MQRIYHSALELLENLGMADPLPEFIEVVTDAGGHVDEEGRLRYPRHVVEKGIEMAAKSWVWHGFD